MLRGHVDESYPTLLRQLLWLATPVLAEHLLHVGVGLVDVYLANHLVEDASINAAATAAVGTITYIMWFIGLLVGAVGTGATAIIARATGAKHRTLANSVCGQAIAVAALMGAITGVGFFLLAEPIAALSQLEGPARVFAVDYLRLLGLAMPLMMVLFAANACLRGAGDTLAPAVVMIVVDVVNIVVSFALVYGLWGAPRLGFAGIVIGTVAAYSIGGLIQVLVLLSGRRGVRLFPHRLRPHWHTLKRLLKIGIPSGLEGVLQWVANFGVLVIVNTLHDIQAAAHINTIRLESISFMLGFAVATAAATMVGQSLGMGSVHRARRSAMMSFAVGGGAMTLLGLVFIAFPGWCAALLSNDPKVIALTADCLRLAGFIQGAFAAAMIFSAALRGAGDTFNVMLLNLISVLGVRLTGVLLVTQWLGLTLVGIWFVLCFELVVRGGLMFARYKLGRWHEKQV